MSQSEIDERINIDSPYYVSYIAGYESFMNDRGIEFWEHPEMLECLSQRLAAAKETGLRWQNSLVPKGEAEREGYAAGVKDAESAYHQPETQESHEYEYGEIRQKLREELPPVELNEYQAGILDGYAYYLEQMWIYPQDAPDVYHSFLKRYEAEMAHLRSDDGEDLYSRGRVVGRRLAEEAHQEHNKASYGPFDNAFH